MRSMKVFFCFALLFLHDAGETTIIETEHVADVLPYVDKDSWFLVDLDNTMFEARQALGHANWFYDEMNQRLQKGMSREEAIRDAYPGWVKTQAVCPVKPLEDNFIPDTAIEHVPPVYFREIAEFQSKFLDKIMSNESARLLMENGLD